MIFSKKIKKKFEIYEIMRSMVNGEMSVTPLSQVTIPTHKRNKNAKHFVFTKPNLNFY